MTRRALVLILAIVPFGFSLSAHGQTGKRVAVIGVLWGGETSFGTPYLNAARHAFADLGYVEGKDFVVRVRFGERKPGAVEALANELVQRQVDVIVAAGDPSIRAARHATSTIPIVMLAAGDPVRSGYVSTLARPGGNVTGTTFLSTDLAGKRLELLKEAMPGLARAAVLWNPDNPGGPAEFSAAQTAAENLRLTLLSAEVRKISDLEPAFKLLVQEHVQAVLVLTDPFTARLAGKPIAELALKDRLPVMCDLREFTREGTLISYGPNLMFLAQRAAVFVDKILKGAKPADLPVEQPTKFELVINLKTAKAFGLTIPPSLLARADQVIE